MYIQSKIRSSLIRWICVVLFTFNIGSVRSVIVHQNHTLNNTCQSVMHRGQQLYQCELNLKAKEASERLMIRFRQLQLNCSDTLSVYDSSNTFGTPAFKFTCEDNTESVGSIHSTNDSFTIEFITADELGFDSNDFNLIYASFTSSTNGCNGFVCKDENEYCIDRELQCDAVIHCSDGSDESDCERYDDHSNEVKLIALVSFVSFIILLGIIWLCAHTRNVMRNRAAIQRNGINNN